MSEEKMDLILTVVSELKEKMDKFDSRMDKFDSRMDKFDSRMDKFDSRMDNLENELSDFKKQVIKSFDSLKRRIDTLEKQMLSIGLELKEEIRHQIGEVRDDINRLENTIMLEQAEKLQDRVRVRELESRVARLEEKFRLAA